MAVFKNFQSVPFLLGSSLESHTENGKRAGGGDSGAEDFFELRTPRRNANALRLPIYRPPLGLSPSLKTMIFLSQPFPSGTPVPSYQMFSADIKYHHH